MTEPGDVVVADSSTDYAAARAAFERDFPGLPAGGRYVLAGWNAAHVADATPDPGSRSWVGRPAVTNLVVELVVVAGTHPGVVASVVVTGDTVEVVRGDAPLPSPFRIADHYANRGLRFRPLL